MNTTPHNRLFISCAAALLFLAAQVSFVGTGRAQIISHGDLFGPGAPPPMVGIELGLGQHSQIGTMQCTCNSLFSGGNGKGFIGSLFFELPIDYEWAVGIKGGIDFKNFSTTTSAGTNIDTVVFEQGGRDSAVEISDYQNLSVKTTYFNVAPYVQYQFFRMGPFVQLGLDFGFLSTNNSTQNRQLPPGTTVNGQSVTYTNGTLEEQVQIGPQSVSSLRLGLLLSAGYNIQVSERSIFSPLITYDFPLNAAGTISGFGWKIGSLYASALIKFQL